MVHNSKSGRVVIDIGHEKKRELYAALSLTDRTLKEWFTQRVDELRSSSLQSSAAQGLPTVPSTRELGSALHRGSSSASKKRYSVVSMFSGCGGMDLGFTGDFEFMGTHYPKLPFEVVWANDTNAAACRTYAKNLGHESLCEDVWTVLDTLPDQADVIIGGFPCQDISVNGKQRGVNGTRSGLYKAMVEAVRRVHPKVFVAENVKGLLMASGRDALGQVLADFGSLGYSVSYKLYQAADYGVPQTRERVLIVGTASDVSPFTPPAADRESDDWISAKMAIGDLESRIEDADFSHIWSRASKSPEQGNRRLRAERAGYTIRAECHGNIQWHYKLARRISMREAARIQSFPDNFLFDAKLRETERMIGNAVPPVLAWHAARSVLACLQ